ncbi:hypothetical protein AX17_006349, partial [Amanita inopinata Kibby_2008]
VLQDLLQIQTTSVLVLAIKHNIRNFQSGNSFIADNHILNAFWNINKVLTIVFKKDLSEAQESVLRSTLAAEQVKVLRALNVSYVKFSNVPTITIRGDNIPEMEYKYLISCNPAWKDIEFHGKPVFIKVLKQECLGLQATLKVGIINDNVGSKAKSIIGRTFNFNGNIHYCDKWIIKPSMEICGNCSRWGHLTQYCRFLSHCSKCTGFHLTTLHDAAIEDDMDEDINKCVNCHGDHWSNDKSCEFFTLRFNLEKQKALAIKIKEEHRKTSKQIEKS